MRHAAKPYHPFAHACRSAMLAALVGCAPSIAPTPASTHFGQVPVVAQQAARCTDSQGSWYGGLMACACPAETLFHPRDGCLAAPPLQRAFEHDAPDQVMLRLGTLAMCLDTRPGNGGHSNRLLVSDMVDGASLAMHRLTLLTQATSYVLTNALAQDIDAAYAVWVLGDFSSVGPHRSLWHPHPGRLPAIKKACPTALQKHHLRHSAALCDTAASMQRELRKRGIPSVKRASPWDSVTWESMPEPHLARLDAQWKSVVTQAHYVIHLQDAGALQRHIRVQSEDEQLVLFLDATGAVTAGALAWGAATFEPMFYFDASWQAIEPS